MDQQRTLVKTVLDRNVYGRELMRLKTMVYTHVPPNFSGFAQGLWPFVCKFSDEEFSAAVNDLIRQHTSFPSASEIVDAIQRVQKRQRFDQETAEARKEQERIIARTPEERQRIRSALVEFSQRTKVRLP